MNTVPLFHNTPLKFDEQYSRFRRLIKMKTSACSASFGVFIEKSGDEVHNLLLVVTLKNGTSKTLSIKAADMADMMAKANEFMESI